MSCAPGHPWDSHVGKSSSFLPSKSMPCSPKLVARPPSCLLPALHLLPKPSFEPRMQLSPYPAFLSGLQWMKARARVQEQKEPTKQPTELGEPTQNKAFLRDTLRRVSEPDTPVQFVCS